VRELFREEKGSVIIILALCMSVFVGLAALVTDAGLVYLTRDKMQNAVDAAALAGAQDLQISSAAALEKAQNYGVSNGLDLSEITIECVQSEKFVKVSATRNINFTFAKIIGHDSGVVTAVAKARSGPIKGLKGAAPLGISLDTWQIGQPVTLKVGSHGAENGWFSGLALGTEGADIYEANLTQGYNQWLKKGDIINIQTGNISNPTNRAVNFRVAECHHIPTCTPTSYDPDCERLIKIPVITNRLNNQVEIVGFAYFLVNGVTGQGVDCYISGQFVRGETSGEIDENSSSDYGLYGVKLVQ